MERYASGTADFRHRQLPGGMHVVVGPVGDHLFLDDRSLEALRSDPSTLPLALQAQLRSRFILRSRSPEPGSRRLFASRQAARKESLTEGPALHIIVPTLQCAHSCRYCQVSRSLESTGFAMSAADLDAACDTVFQSSAPALTVEFQGGDPLLRFDLIERAVERMAVRAVSQGRSIRFVVASTLHQLDDVMCRFFAKHGILLSTSIDGPAALHNRNRPTPGRDAHERTCFGMERARRALGSDAVSALMTTTRESLSQPEAIVDEYVRLGLHDIFLRSMSAYGFARRNQLHLGYTQEEFAGFYKRALDRVLEWNRRGTVLREVQASIILNKILSTFDAGYVDLQSPTGAGTAVLVYNYDGYVYPSDEARMLAESGETSLRLGPIGTPLALLQASPVRDALIRASEREAFDDCRMCAYGAYCAPNPVDAQGQFGTPFVPAASTEHCRRHLWLFDTVFELLRTADAWTLDLFHDWAFPGPLMEVL